MKKTHFLKMMVLLVLVLLSGCAKQKKSDQLDTLDQLSASEIEEIECAGTTGGANGTFQYDLTESEIEDFTDLLLQVELGKEVDEKEALSSGAVTYYTIEFTDGESMKISPGSYFMIDNTYYVFENYDELWESFIEFNSRG